MEVLEYTWRSVYSISITHHKTLKVINNTSECTKRVSPCLVVSIYMHTYLVYYVCGYYLYLYIAKVHTNEHAKCVLHTYVCMSSVFAKQRCTLLFMQAIIHTAADYIISCK